MKARYIFVLAAMAFVAQSCITDDSTAPSGTSSKLSLSQPLATTYTLDRWDTLKIAPQVVQTNAQKNIKYEWEVNYKVVSTDPQLDYICSEFGNYPCRLKISNGDDIQYYEFALDVQYSYVGGLYILALNAGKTIVSYLPEPSSRKSFTLDVLERNNPGIDFGSDPRAIDFTIARDGKTPLVYVAVGSPTVIYELNGNLMTKVYTTTTAGNLTWMKRSALTYPKSELLMVDHKPYRLTLSETTPFNLGTSIESALGSSVTLADATASWKRQDLRYTDGYVLFDNAQGRLIGQNVASTKVPTQLLPGIFTGDSLVGMGSVDSERNLALITWNKVASKFKFYYLFPGFYPNNVANTQAALVKEQRSMPTTSGIEKGSIVRSAPTKNLVYYTSGNKLYAYNVLSNGNFPTAPLQTFGLSDETIVDLYITSDDSRLYVATNASSGTLPGSIYCYDLDTRTLLWQKQHFTGRIRGIAFRE